VQVTGLLPVHVPVWHASVWVHAFPSLQLVPSVCAGFEQTPEVGSQVPATWHWSCAVHVTGLAPVQVPVWQVSVWVQALPSLQLVPSGCAGFEQMPVEGLQAPIAWQLSMAVHVTGLAPVQVPAWHVSDWVHALPSLQEVPSGCEGVEHIPVVGLHVPTA